MKLSAQVLKMKTLAPGLDTDITKVFHRHWRSVRAEGSVTLNEGSVTLKSDNVTHDVSSSVVTCPSKIPHLNSHSNGLVNHSSHKISTCNGENDTAVIPKDGFHKCSVLSSYNSHVLNGSAVDGTSGERFRVATYNILSDQCIPNGQYLHCPQDVRYLNARHGHIMSEVVVMSPDVVCFQEVETSHYQTTLQPSLQCLGYSGVHVSTAVGQGLAIFWKTSQFSLICKQECTTQDACEKLLKMKGEELRIDQKADIREALNRPESCLGVRLRHLVSKREVCIVNVHIAWTELRGPALQTLQIWMSMKLLEQISSESHESNDYCNNSRSQDVSCLSCSNHSESSTQLQKEDTHAGVPQGSRPGCARIMCGDFNTPPHYPGYRLITQGSVTLQDFMDLACMTHEKTKADQVSILRAYEMVNLLPDAYNTNGFNLKSSYKSILGEEPRITNCDDASEDAGVIKPLCLDYIWYSPETLEPTGVLETPPDEAIFQHRCLPSVLFPSDHLPLLSEFCFK